MLAACGSAAATLRRAGAFAVARVAGAFVARVFATGAEADGAATAAVGSVDAGDAARGRRGAGFSGVVVIG